MRLAIFIVGVCFLAGLVGLLAQPSVREINRSREIDKEIATLQQEAEKINANNGLLREKITYLRSDNYKERIAKNKLNLKNNGEKVVMVQLSNKQDEKNYLSEKNVLGVEEKKVINKQNIPNYQKWWQLFFNKK